jgi:tetratricopeptide (TPR) repeat protein
VVGNYEDHHAAVAKATRLTDIGRAADAVEILKTVAASDPSNEHVLCELARALLAVGSPGEALQAANAAAVAAPEHEWPHRLASIALGGIGQPREAVRAAYEAVRLAPDEWQTHSCLAGALARNPHSRVEALEAAKYAVALNPDEPHTHYVVGEVARLMGQHKLATQALNNALRIQPHHADSVTALASIQLDQGHYASAIGGYKHVLSGDPHQELASRNANHAALLLARFAHWYVTLTCFFVLGTMLDEPISTGAVLFCIGIVTVGAGIIAFLNRRVVAQRQLFGLLLRRNRTLRTWVALDAIAIVTTPAVLLVPSASRDPVAATLSLFVIASALFALHINHRLAPP